MYLKRLDIFGFKSFPRRTVLEFEQGLTAVVGPNGSGKSNIADAVRWALGEQSMKAVRGTKTEDVIFGGGGNRGRSGLAEVSLTFDNADGWFKVDFNEIAITRRAHRSGENEYLLNGARVRLKDIQDLLRSVGLGVGGNSVINQGQIDAALTLKPDGLRELLEESAGVSRYYARRDEARRRLEQTNRNLDRIRDLCSEIEPRLEQLRIQAEVAGKSGDIRIELEAMLKQLFGHRLYLASNAERLASESKSESEEQLRKLEANEIDAVEGPSEDEVNSMIASSEQLSIELQQLRDELSDTKARCAVAEQGVLFEFRAGEELQERIDENDKERCRVCGELELLTAEYEQKKQVIGELESADSDQDKPLLSAIPDLSGIKQVVVEARAEAVRVTTEVSRLQDLVKSSSLRSDELVRDLGEAQIEHSLIEESEIEAHQIIDSCDKELSSISTALSELRKHIDTTDRAVVDARNGLDKVRTQLTRDRAILEAMKDELKVLEDARNGGDEGIQRIRKRNQSSNIVGLLRDGIRDVPAEFDKAVGAVLFHALDDIVIENTDDLLTVISDVRSEKLSGISLRSLSGFPQLPSITWPSDVAVGEKGVIGALSSLMEVNAEYLNMMEPLLSSIIVVQDLSTALTIRNEKVSISGHVLVTLDGDVISPDGSISVSADELSSGLTVTHRITDLKKKIDECCRNIEIGEQAEVEAQRGLESAETDKAANLLDMEQATNNQSKIVASKRGVEEELNSLKKQRVYWGEVIDRVTVSVKQLESQKRDTESKLTEYEVLLDRALGNADAAENDLSEAQSSVSSLENEQAKILLDRQSLENYNDRIINLKRQLEALDQALDRLGSRAETSAATKLTAETEVQKCLVKLDQLRATEREKVKSVDAASAAVAELRIERERALLAQQSLEVEIGKLRNAIERSNDRIAASRQQMEDIESRGQEELGAIGMQPERYEGSIGKLESEIARLRHLVHEIGPVNLLAPQQYEEDLLKYEDLKSQIEDMELSIDELVELTSNLENAVRREFMAIFEDVREGFRRYFRLLFDGGEADILLDDPIVPAESGIAITTKLPGKRVQLMTALSGGERSLVSAALLFGMISARPGPFCVLDEVDAALDDQNTGRFRRILEDFVGLTQFIVITHNAGTMEGADAIFGVSMANDGISQVVSLRVREEGLLSSDNGSVVSVRD
tara:strand:+ start:15437 stop:19000 length:3564 start_codon:yes stop_codon:yes gene_type:complete